MNIPEWLLLPFFSGTVAFHISKSYYSRTFSTTHESERLTASIIVGLPATFIVLLFKELCPLETFTESLSLLGNLFFCIFLTAVGTIVYLTKFNKKPEDKATKVTSNLEAFLHDRILNFGDPNQKKYPLFLIETSNRILYAGYIISMDFDAENEMEKTIEVLCYKSGCRNQDGSVEYLNYYIYPKNNQDYPSMFIYLREVISIREYNSSLNSHFGHPDGEDPAQMLLPINSL